MKKRFKASYYQPVLIALISMCVFVFIIFRYNESDKLKRETDARTNLLEMLVAKKSQLEKALYSRLYYTKGIAAYYSINPGASSDDFYKLADELINKDSVINSMALSKDCIIGAIYPLKGHESALGLDLLAHPMRRKIVESTIQTKKTFVAGPVELVEGGIAFISYTPIFTKTKSDTSKFWGVTDIVILKDKLFNEIGLYVKNDNYKFALKGTDGTGKDGPCFWGDESVFNSNPVTVDIYLPTGNWTFASVPLNGWESLLRNSGSNNSILYIAAFLVSFLVWMLSKSMIKIRINERELKALFGSMQDLIIEFNSKGEYVQIAPTNDSLLVKSPDELLGKSMYDVFDKNVADYFVNAINECIKTKKMVILDYPLEIKSERFWFQARISYLTDNSVIYVAHDNTQKKCAEEQLIESERKLKELNAAKDKFFNILAHDLRGPFQSFLGYSEMLSSSKYNLSREEVIKIGNHLNSSLQKQYKLLNDLLDWSKLQSANYILDKVNTSLSKEVEEVFELMSFNAEQKGISLINKVPDDVFINADIKMLNIVLRNLISNSIKFTDAKGKIVLSAVSNSQNVEITVEDNGTGIPEEDIDKLFKIEENYTTKGTMNETGSGLGLNLCKEIVEKHGGNIKVESVLGKGSKFIFTIPF
jgi:signal transduction histidine kinase/sensor domain CHASE-containing protein